MVMSNSEYRACGLGTRVADHAGSSTRLENNLARSESGPSACISGADERSRTLDLLITNELLYQLSYIGIGAPDNDPDPAPPSPLLYIFF